MIVGSSRCSGRGIVLSNPRGYVERCSTVRSRLHGLGYPQETAGRSQTLYALEGGHFAAWEQPDSSVSEMRASFATLR